MTKRIIITSVIALLLSGCTTAMDYQNQCEKEFPKFQDMTACLKEKIHADPRMQMRINQAYVQRYLLEADKLSEMVRKKQISEIDARIKLSDLYLQLKSQQRGEIQSQQIINNMNRPVSTNCTGFGNTVNCTSY